MKRKIRKVMNRARKIEKHKLLKRKDFIDLKKGIKKQKSFLRRILEKTWFIKDEDKGSRRRKIYK